MAVTFVMCCVVFIKATFGHGLGPGAVRGIAPRRGREPHAVSCRGPDDVIAQGDDAKINVYWRIENGGGGESLIERS